MRGATLALTLSGKMPQTVTHPINAHQYGSGGNVTFQIDQTVSSDDVGWLVAPADFHAVPDRTRVRVEPGEYTIRVQRHTMGGSRSEWQRREHVIIEAADPDNPPVFRVPDGEAGRVCQFTGSHVALRNLVFDNKNHFNGGDIALRAHLADGLLWEGLRVDGWSGTKDNGGDWTFYPTVEAGGQAEIRRCEKAGPSQFDGHGTSAGAGGVFGMQAGETWFTKCHIENQGGDGGLYTGKHPGSTNFYRCYFANNDMAVMRMAAGSEMRECILVMDWESAHPDNEFIDPTGTNGVYLSSAQHGKSGGGVYDCDIHIKSVHRTGRAAINVNNSDCPDAIERCRIRVDVDDIWPLHMGDTEEMRLSNHTPPERSDTRLRDIHISGSGDMDGAALHLANRDGSTVDGLHLDIPDGVDATDISGGGVSIGSVTRGDADQPRTDPAGVLDGDLAPGDPDEPDDTNDEPGDGGTRRDDGPDDTTPMRTLDIIGTGERASYEFTVDGDLSHNSTRGTVDTQDAISGASAEGVVVSGPDAYDFSGSVTAFAIDGEATVKLDGEAVDPATLVESESDGSDSGDGDSGSGDSGDDSDGSDGPGGGNGGDGGRGSDPDDPAPDEPEPDDTSPFPIHIPLGTWELGGVTVTLDESGLTITRS